MQSVALALLTVISSPVLPADYDYGMRRTYLNADLPAGDSDVIGVYHPRDLSKGPFPVVVFAHGMYGGGIGGRWFYNDVLRKYVNNGFIVLFPESCRMTRVLNPTVTTPENLPRGYCPEFHNDVRMALKVAIEKKDTLDALKAADFSRVGVAGHSMGGHAALLLLGEVEELNIVAVAAIVPVTVKEWVVNATVPIFFATGTGDETILPEVVFESYNATPSVGSVYANHVGTGHNAVGPSRGFFGDWTPVFMRCHVSRDNESCKAVYDSMCSAEMDGCFFKE